MYDWSGRFPYVSPIERSGLEVTGGTLNHDILSMQTHQALFRVALTRGSGKFLGQEGVWYIPTVRWGRSARNLVTARYVSLAIRETLKRRCRTKGLCIF